MATADDYAEVSAIWGGIGDMYGLRGVASFGDTDKAEAAYLKSLGFEQQALALNPQHLRALRGLAINRMKVANSRQERDPESAAKDYQAAVDSLAKLPSQFRRSMGVQRLEAMILVKLGETLPEIARAREALAPLEKGCAIYRGFVTLDPDDTRARYDLATCVYHSAVAQYRLGAKQKSRDQYLEVVRLMDQLLVKFPANIAWKGQVATSAEAAGGLSRELGQKEEGDRLVRRGLNLAVEVAEHLDSAANDLSRAGRMLVSVEPPAWRDVKKGLAFCRRAVEKSNGTRPMLNLELARALRANSLDGEARAVLEKTLVTLAPGNSATRTMIEDELKALSELAKR
jgi:tetratricopeptide (TPR) repeat protein